jgi:integrase/recombinase XerC
MVGAAFASWRKRLAPQTCYSRRTDLRHILEALRTFGAPQIDVPKIPKPQPRATVATRHELGIIIGSAPPWLRLFVLLYIQAGLRFSETLRVNPQTYDHENKTVTVQVKGGRDRKVELSEDITRLMDSVDPAPGEPYIMALKGRTISPEAVRQAWKRLRKTLNINPNVNAHDLRRSAATILYEETHDLRAAQELLGHKNLATTLTYLAPLAPDQTRKYAELLRFDRFKSEVKQ